jgi:hypothetical protein
MVETAMRQRPLSLLRQPNTRSRADHGSRRSDSPRRKKHQRKCGSSMQVLQQQKKTTSSNGVGRIPSNVSTLAVSETAETMMMIVREASDVFDKAVVGLTHKQLSCN